METPKVYNGSYDPCDTYYGPCQCGAYHLADEDNLPGIRQWAELDGNQLKNKIQGDNMEMPTHPLQKLADSLGLRANGKTTFLIAGLVHYTTNRDWPVFLVGRTETEAGRLAKQAIAEGANGENISVLSLEGLDLTDLPRRGPVVWTDNALREILKRSGIEETPMHWYEGWIG